MASKARKSSSFAEAFAPEQTVVPSETVLTVVNNVHDDAPVTSEATNTSAAADAAASSPVPRANHMTREDVFDRARVLGANEGTGALSRRELALDCIRAGDTPDGIEIIKPDDAAKLYDAFMQASQAARNVSTVGAEDNTSKTRDVQISNIKTFIKLGQKHRPEKGRDFVDCMQRVDKVFTENKAVLGKNERLYDAMLKVARVHLNDAKSYPMPASDAEILEILMKGSNKADKSPDEQELAVLKSAFTQLDAVYSGKIDKDTKELVREPRRSDDLQSALAALERRIKTLEMRVSKYN